LSKNVTFLIVIKPKLEILFFKTLKFQNLLNMTEFKNFWIFSYICLVEDYIRTANSNFTNEFDETQLITARKVAGAIGASQTTTHLILKKLLGKWKKVSRMADLNPQKELDRAFAAEELLYNRELVWGENYYKDVIFSDETYVQLQPSSLGTVGSYGKKLFVKTVKYPKKVCHLLFLIFKFCQFFKTIWQFSHKFDLFQIRQIFFKIWQFFKKLSNLKSIVKFLKKLSI
jgi:hypothetical protein